MANLIVHWAVFISVFAIVWFLGLIVLLPIGLSGEVNEHGAPASPRLLLKAAIATLIALVGLAAFYAVVWLGIITL